MREPIHLHEWNPRVLILLPLLDEADHLARLFQSVLTQSHSNWILVFQDNASTDSSKSLLLDFMRHDQRIFGKFLDTRVSVSENWNSLANWALESYASDFVCWLGGDDWWGEELYLDRLIGANDQFSEARIVMPNLQPTDSGKTVQYSPRSIEMNGYFRVFRLVRKWDSVNVIYALYPRKTFENILHSPMARINQYSGSDWWWTMAAIRDHKVYCERDVTYFKSTWASDRWAEKQNYSVSETFHTVQRLRSLLNVLCDPYRFIWRHFVHERQRYNLLCELFVLVALVYFIFNAPLVTVRFFLSLLSRFLKRLFKRGM